MDATRTNARFLPNKTFRDKQVLHFGRDEVDVYYFGAGHTNGDTVVVFPGSRAVYMGDLYAGRSVPIIDGSSGGSGVVYPETLARATAELKNINIVIPGQDLPPLDEKRAAARAREVFAWDSWQDFVEFAGFMREFVTSVQNANKAGKSEIQAAADLKLPDTYKDYRMDQAASAISAIYKELPR
jgi:glyoxylase-like metal-dependent hydrolase (beta-lactamase superfamily II)